MAVGGVALVFFAGEQAYFCACFYPSKAVVGLSVPTWNFLAVLAFCQG
ncbi:FMN-binding negative transcriptional regulator, partial [Pseudomonas sp. CCC3.1]|nr:FMN-binding negative transcriptional regulator [Pseudomonas sp. CCC3.1]